MEFGGEPSVRYRGIFLNDEDWGLEPWAAKTFEPETGSIGPKTYAKLFELLLRLKANTVWPAMHEVTRPFNSIPENRKIADDYAIVMGSSHAEPLLRNNVGEWRAAKDDYNFVTNADGVTHYWEERVKENASFENIYTLGMRGIHDSPIQGVKDQKQRIPLLEKIFSVQRELLTRYVNRDIEKVPQIFCPYKEVLADYRAGLKVPEDVTIVFPDDNFGYVRQYPTREERKRKGGFGIYYHISYLGRPLSYTWLNTTPPALIWEEMSKAYDRGIERFWIVNVGDLKPGEIGAEFFLQMAWNIRKWRPDNLNDFLKSWARREFGEQHAAEIAAVMDEYYRLGFARKPEHLQWYLPGESPRGSDLSAVDYGDEVQRRLDAYRNLRDRSQAVYDRLAPEKKDAFYELVLYPVRGAALANERFLAAEKSVLYAEQKRSSARIWARRSADADAAIKADAAYFNEKLAGGKWRYMMSPEMGDGQWTSMRAGPVHVPESISNAEVPNAAGLGIAIEGRVRPAEAAETAALPVFNVFTKDTRFIDVFNTGRSPASWAAKADREWIKIDPASGDLNNDTRIQVSIDWTKVPAGQDVSGEIVITSGSETRKVRVPVFDPASPRPADLEGFVESNGVVSIEAELFTRKIDRNGAAWQIIPGLGRTGDSVSVFPVSAESVDPSKLATDSPLLEYNFYVFTPGDFAASCFLVPTQPLVAGTGLRYAIAVDDHPPQQVTVDRSEEVGGRKWSQNVLNASTVGTSKLVLSGGPHVLKIYMVDAGVVLDKIVLNAGGSRPSYLGPPQTLVR